MRAPFAYSRNAGSNALANPRWSRTAWEKFCFYSRARANRSPARWNPKPYGNIAACMRNRGGGALSALRYLRDDALSRIQLQRPGSQRARSSCRPDLRPGSVCRRVPSPFRCENITPLLRSASITAGNSLVHNCAISAMISS